MYNKVRVRDVCIIFQVLSIIGSQRHRSSSLAIQQDLVIYEGDCFLV